MAKGTSRRTKPPSVEDDAPPLPTAPTWREVAVDVGVPFAISRVLFLVVAGLFAEVPRGLSWVPRFAERGWAYSPSRWLDVWARWDSAWYMEIVTAGYQKGGYAIGQYSSLAFFPLYPQAVRLLYRLLPAAWQGESAALALGVLVANLCGLAATAMLYWHVRARFSDRATAQRSVAFLLVFPTAFFLGCFYTEATFLLLAVAAYHMAWRRRWAAAAVLGALLSATRSVGVLMVLPFLWMQLEDAGFKPGRLGKRVCWLLLVPAGFVAYAIYLWHLTGDLGAVVLAQRAWRKEFASPLALFGTPPKIYGDLVHLDRLLTLAFAAVAVWLLRWRSWRADALVVLVVLASYVFTGTPISASRYLLMAFPIFVWLADQKPAGVRYAYVGAALATQSALWIYWVLMCWVA